MTKSFMMMLAVFMVLGVSLGGAFVGGVALGKSQGDDSAADSSGPPAGSSLQQQAADQSGQGFQGGNASPEELARLRERIQSGELGPDDLAQIRQRFQPGEGTPDELSQLRQRFQPGEGTPDELSQLRQRFQPGDASREELAGLRQRFQAGQLGLTGTINEVEGNTVTVDTNQGVMQATINDETLIQKIAVAEPEDLQGGVRVTVLGQPGVDGPVDARLILITSEGASGLFDGGFFSGTRPQRDRTAGGGDSFQHD